MTCTSVEFSVTSPWEIPNLGFENWTDQTSGYVSASILSGTYSYTSPNQDASNVYWESGNLGAAVADAVLTDKEATPAISGSTYAAVLKSQWAGKVGIGAFAAGSIYSGYPESVSSSGATLKYGRPYQGYPTHLRGYYKYTPGSVNYVGDRTPSDGLQSGETDQFVINIALCTKQQTVVSTTSSVVTYPFDDSSVFAYGTYYSSETKDETGETSSVELLNGYVPFKITLNYKESAPKDGSFYILIMASSSRYGDYFTGSTSSVLYIDEFSLDYDYDAAAFSNTDLKDLTPVDINE